MSSGNHQYVHKKFTKGTNTEQLLIKSNTSKGNAILQKITSFHPLILDWPIASVAEWLYVRMKQCEIKNTCTYVPFACCHFFTSSGENDDIFMQIYETDAAVELNEEITTMRLTAKSIY